MKLKSIRNLPTTDEITEENSVLIARNGVIFRMLMQNFRRYLAYAAGADVLGVPVPTAADAGKVPVVNAKGEYALEHVTNTCLLWENPDPSADFAAQTIACDTTAYAMFAVVFKYSKSSGERETVTFPNDGNAAQLHSIYLSGPIVMNARRTVTADTSGIAFGGGRYAQYASANGFSDSYAVPVAIYGIR